MSEAVAALRGPGRGPGLRPPVGAWLSAPAGLLLAGFILIPAAAVLVLAFFDWDLGAGGLRFVGLGNFVELWRDGLFWAALGNTLLFAGIVTPVTLVLATMLALAIEARSSFRTTYRAIHLLPVLAAFPAMAMAWEVLLNPTVGPLNQVLSAAGLEPPNWLRDQRFVLWTLMAVGVWQHLGIAIILIIGGLKSILRELYDAAEMDGAHRALDRFMTVTLPGLGPVAVLVATLIGMRGLGMFDKTRVLTQGGPGYASETLMHTLFVESFVYLRTGYGAALTVVFLCLAILVSFGRRAVDRKVHYA